MYAFLNVPSPMARRSGSIRTDGRRGGEPARLLRIGSFGPGPWSPPPGSPGRRPVDSGLFLDHDQRARMLHGRAADGADRLLIRGDLADDAVASDRDQDVAVGLSD